MEIVQYIETPPTPKKVRAIYLDPEEIDQLTPEIAKQVERFTGVVCFFINNGEALSARVVPGIIKIGDVIYQEDRHFKKCTAKEFDAMFEEDEEFEPISLMEAQEEEEEEDDEPGEGNDGEGGTDDASDGDSGTDSDPE